MKRKILTTMVLAGMACLVYAFASPQYEQGEPSPAGRRAPDFAFTRAGRPARLSDLRGKIVVLNFWATWCPPCVDEAPSLNRLAQRIQDRGGVVLGVSVDEDAAAYDRFLAGNHIAFPNYRDPSKKIPLSYGTTMYPETYVINREGRIDRKIVGQQDWTSPELFSYFDALLEKK